MYMNIYRFFYYSRREKANVTKIFNLQMKMIHPYVFIILLIFLKETFSN